MLGVGCLEKFATKNEGAARQPHTRFSKTARIETHVCPEQKELIERAAAWS